MHRSYAASNLPATHKTSVNLAISAVGAAYLDTVDHTRCCDYLSPPPLPFSPLPALPARWSRAALATHASRGGLRRGPP